MVLGSDQAELEADLFYSGHRLTKLRKALINIFMLRRQPLSALDLGPLLKTRGLTPHKVTLYRELDFLEDKQIIQKVDLADGWQRFEFIDRPHHHHAVCVKCKKIEDVELEHDNADLEKLIKTKNNFQILRHTLEFFGLCGECKNV
jgi:Fur family transcriptional regulator, ferric uptake regulator